MGEEEPLTDDTKNVEEIKEEPLVKVTKKDEIKDQKEGDVKLDEETAKTNGPKEKKTPVIDFFKDLFAAK